jgi:hypothetical protein
MLILMIRQGHALNVVKTRKFLFNVVSIEISLNITFFCLFK